jgi:L-cysteate sulfo-lyase
MTGNLVLDRLFGAVVHDIPWDEDRNARLRGIGAELRAAGRRPYFVPYGASDALGAMGYARMVVEFLEQCSALDVMPTYIVPIRQQSRERPRGNLKSIHNPLTRRLLP